MLGAGEQLDLERGAALASAINDWQTAEWLDPEPRLRASINVAYEDGELVGPGDPSGRRATHASSRCSC